MTTSQKFQFSFMKKSFVQMKAPFHIYPQYKTNRTFIHTEDFILIPLSLIQQLKFFYARREAKDLQNIQKYRIERFERNHYPYKEGETYEADQMIVILSTEHAEGNNHFVKFAICLNESFQTIVNALVSRLKDLNIAAK